MLATCGLGGTGLGCIRASMMRKMISAMMTTCAPTDSDVDSGLRLTRNGSGYRHGMRGQHQRRQLLPMEHAAHIAQHRPPYRLVHHRIE